MGLSLLDYLKSLNKVITHFELRKGTELTFELANHQRETRYQSFTLKNQTCINDLYDQMVSFGFIKKPETDKRNFVNAFKGIKVNPQIIWHGDIEELRYLVRNLIKEQLITPLGKDHWVVTCNCFKNSDGTKFTTEQFRTSHEPKDTSNLNMILSTARSG